MKPTVIIKEIDKYKIWVILKRDSFSKGGFVLAKFPNDDEGWEEARSYQEGVLITIYGGNKFDQMMKESKEVEP